MALLPIITAPDSRLREVSQPVDAVDDSVRKLLDDMLETMYAAPGVGLSAIQVGVAQRIIVIDTAKDPDPPHPVRMINPEIIWQADEIGPFEEGCLSFPDQYEEVERPGAVHVRYMDENGEIRTIKADLTKLGGDIRYVRNRIEQHLRREAAWKVTTKESLVIFVVLQNVQMFVGHILPGSMHQHRHCVNLVVLLCVDP